MKQTHRTLFYPDGPRAHRVLFATTFKDRLLGLMFRTSMENDDALFFEKTNAIHTYGMQMPIDVLFLAGDPTGEMEIISAHHGVAPMKTFRERGADHTLELRAGALCAFGEIPSRVRLA